MVIYVIASFLFGSGLRGLLALRTARRVAREHLAEVEFWKTGAQSALAQLEQAVNQTTMYKGLLDRALQLTSENMNKQTNERMRGHLAKALTLLNGPMLKLVKGEDDDQ